MSRTRTISIDAERIKSLMKEKNINPERISMELGYSAGYFSKSIILGKMPMYSIRALSNVLECDADYLIKKEETAKTNMPLFTEAMMNNQIIEMKDSIATLSKKIDELTNICNSIHSIWN